MHRHAPRLGEFSIFNRSHYEDVLVVRVHDLAPKELWKERYGHIADFEELLAEHGTIVLKYFLHISRKEQKERLLEREGDAARPRWKLNAERLGERDYWDDYTAAYEDAISSDRGAARALDRRAGERQVVPQPGGRASRSSRRCASTASAGSAGSRTWAARPAPRSPRIRAEGNVRSTAPGKRR